MSIAVLLLIGAVASMAAVPAVAATSRFTFVHQPRLLTVQPAGDGYNLIFRLNHPLPRRADGSIDAGIRTATGFESEFTTADKRDNCYFGATDGRSKHTGTRVSVRLLLGSGHDPVGKVQSIQTLTARPTSGRGTAGRHGRFTAEVKAARALGCNHVDSHLG
jgi:hypothetical protein